MFFSHLSFIMCIVVAGSSQLHPTKKPTLLLALLFSSQSLSYNGVYVVGIHDPPCLLRLTLSENVSLRTTNYVHAPSILVSDF